MKRSSYTCSLDRYYDNSSQTIRHGQLITPEKDSSVD